MFMMKQSFHFHPTNEATDEYCQIFLKNRGN